MQKQRLIDVKGTLRILALCQDTNRRATLAGFKSVEHTGICLIGVAITFVQLEEKRELTSIRIDQGEREVGRQTGRRDKIRRLRVWSERRTPPIMLSPVREVEDALLSHWAWSARPSNCLSRRRTSFDHMRCSLHERTK